MNRTSLLFITVAALFTWAACDKKNPDTPTPGPGGEVVTELNGTAIKEDSNMIGIVKDNSGNPIAGVPVSDGYQFVETDKNGVYQIAGNRYARKAYITVPAGYEIPLDNSNHLPAFFSPGTIVRAQQNRCDFTLTPLSTSDDKFTLVMVGDPQCQTESQIERYRNETIPDIQKTMSTMASQYPNPYAITLGDITHDSNDTWSGLKSAMSNVQIAGKYLPFFQCIGNHDHNSKTGSDYESTGLFFENFGPTDYSFNRGNVHIIVMDDIMVSTTSSNSSPNKATWKYDGGFTSAQWKWLQADLDLVKDKDKKCVILCCHIPFRAGASSGGASINKNAYYTELLTAFKAFKEAHIMIGHTHYGQNYIHQAYLTKSKLPIYEHIHGGACGAWWNSNLNVNGEPNGYAIYEVDGKNGTITDWVKKCTNDAIDKQLRVYDGNQVYSGTKGYNYSWITTVNGGAGAYNVGGSSNIFAKGNAVFKDAFVAEVWNDDSKNWKVELWQNGAYVGDFKRAGDGANCDVCVSSFHFNELAKNTDSWVTSTSTHCWYYVPASGEPSSEKNWEVRAIHTVPSSGNQHTYYCTSLTTDYGGFAAK